MTFKIWVYQDSPGRVDFYEWRAGYKRNCKRQIAKLDERIDKLKLVGTALFPQTLSSTDEPGILKIKIQGNPKLRPMLCYGPEEIDKEFTFLLGAIEVSWKYVPSDALAKALRNKVNLIDGTSVKVKYEPV